MQFFWNTLENFSQEELRKFIKFACNQERIPFGNPCRDGGRDMAMNVPPYPMKIAPPDGSGERSLQCMSSNLYIHTSLTGHAHVLRLPFFNNPLGTPDDRYVRAETCMFLVKLPQYSSQEVMTARLRYAIHCMEDPISG